MTKVRTAHGSRKNDLTHLAPQYYNGRNGSQDGIGINLTSSVDVAMHYAGKEGSVYLVDVDTTHFLTISEETYLTEDQATVLKKELETLCTADKYRLATDILGKRQQHFVDEKEAYATFKSFSSYLKMLGLTHDRLKPSVEFGEEDVIVYTPHCNFSRIGSVNTKHLHYCLTLFDNSVATSLLETISSGLILNRENRENDYLSFAKEEKVIAKLDQEFLQKPQAKSLIEGSLNKYSPSEKTHSTLDITMS